MRAVTLLVPSFIGIAGHGAFWRRHPYAVSASSHHNNIHEKVAPGTRETLEFTVLYVGYVSRTRASPHTDSRIGRYPGI